MTDNSPKAIVLRMLDQRMLDMLHGMRDGKFARSVAWTGRPAAQGGTA